MSNKKPDKKPWMKWYWSDWRADEGLRACSLAARGLWAEMLAIMDKADPYGHLLLNGKPMNNKQLANQAGGGVNEKQVEECIAELEAAGVFSRTDGDNLIYCRRMVRDKAKEEEDRSNGSKGGNPKLRKDGGTGATHHPTGGLTGGVKAQKPEARSQKPERESQQPSSLPAASGDARLIADLALEINSAAGKVSDIDKQRTRGFVGDFNQLRALIALGHKPETILAAAKSVIARSGEIKNLWALMAKALPDELTKAAPSDVPDVENQRKKVRLFYAAPSSDANGRVVSWNVKPLEHRAWRFEGGRPFEPDCTIPDEIAAAVCAELGLDVAQERARANPKRAA